MTKFFKKFKKPYFGGNLSSFCTTLAEKKIPANKDCQFLNISFIYNGAKNLKKANNSFLRKMPK